MILTDKCKVDFEKWLFFSEHQSLINDITDQEYYGENMFYTLSSAMQWGVMVDWAESVGITVGYESEGTPSDGNIYMPFIDFDYVGYSNKFDSLPLAREAAIEKLNDTYNDTNG